MIGVCWRAWRDGWLLLTRHATIPRIVVVAFASAITLPPETAALVWWAMVPSLLSRVARRTILRNEARFKALGGHLD